MIRLLSVIRHLSPDMATDYIRYDILAQAALRGVVRTVLADVAKKGLPGEHHFKITFATVAPGVRLSERMRGQYPDAMTIVLQHQFWDLTVDDDGFEVGLSFGGIPERLAVPFEAVTAFFDPAVQFGFQFEALDKQAAEQPSTAAEAPASRPVAVEKSDTALPAPAHGAPAEPVPHEKSGGGEVVRLDRFRKK
jgi:hypothetical protein